MVNTNYILKKINALNSFYTLSFLFILNILLKIVFLDSQSIANDEPFSIYIAQLDVPYIIHHLSLGNNPPLWEIILHYWIKSFGISAFSVRFLPMIFSSLTVIFIYKIGKEFFNNRIAWVSALLFTFSDYQIYFSHEARVYALFALLTSISMYAFLKLYVKVKNKYFAILVLSNAFLIYSHFFGFFVIGIQLFIILFQFSKSNKFFKSVIISQIIVFCLYLPYFPTFIERLLCSNQGNWVKPPNGITEIYNMLWKFSNTPVTTVIFISIIIISSVKFIIIRPKNNSFFCVTIILWFWLPFIGIFAISYLIPMFLDRYLIFLSIAYYIFLSLCIDYILEKKYLKVLLAVVSVFGMAYTCVPNVDNKRNIKEAITQLRYLKDHKKSTIIYVYPALFSFNFEYYWDINCFKDYNNNDIEINIKQCLAADDIYLISSPNEIDTSITNKANKVVIFDALGENPYIDILLSKKFKCHKTYKYWQITNIIEYY